MRAGVMQYVVCIVLLSSVAAGTRLREPRVRSDDAVINVFVLPHSHDDVGWRETAKGYYDLFVSDMYSTVVAALAANGNRTFQSVEMAYFERWWTQDATPEEQAITRELVSQGRLEFVIGGWVMQDEAVSHYAADINQMTLGHSFIYDTFGVRPQFSFQVDPFGASATTPSHFAQMGFNAHIISRIPFYEKTERQQQRDLDFIWRGSDSLGADVEIFTHVLDVYSYCTPFDLPTNWDGNAMPNNISRETSPALTEKNIWSVAELVAADIRNRSKWISTDNLLWPFGCDFEFFNAFPLYNNMDKLMTYMTENGSYSDINMQYAVLSDYFEALHAVNVSWPVRGQEDFFPYIDEPNAYWTGFYTSRPELKTYMRSRDPLLQAAENLLTWSTVLEVASDRNSSYENIMVMRRAQGVSQHHDAITGTEFGPEVDLGEGSPGLPDVASNYHKHLEKATKSVHKASHTAIEDLVNMDPNAPALKFHSSSLNALGKWRLVTGEILPIVIYNPLGWTVTTPVSTLVDRADLTVRDDTGQILLSQADPALPALPYPQDGFTLFKFYFTAVLPPMGYATFFINVNNSLPQPQPYHPPLNMRAMFDEQTQELFPSVLISNDILELGFSISSGLMTEVLFHTLDPLTGEKAKQVTIPLGQDLLAYPSQAMEDVPMSGSYLFASSGDAVPVSTTTGNGISARLLKGPVVESYILKFTDNYEMTIKLYNGNMDPFIGHRIEFDYVLGPLDGNTETITRFTSDLETNGSFYTDNNAFQMMGRTYNGSLNSTIPGNYYPMCGMSYIRGVSQSSGYEMEINFISNAAHGVSSQKDGEFEAMLHRRPMQSDNRGNVQPLDDITRFTSSMSVLVGLANNTALLRHRHLMQINNPPQMFFGPSTTMNQTTWCTYYRSRLSPLALDLPENVHFLTFSTIDAVSNLILFRLEHMFEVNEDPILSQPATVDVDALFAPMIVESLEERSLSAVWQYDEMVSSRWQWSAQGDDKEAPRTPRPRFGDYSNHTLILYPKEIRTFYMTLSRGYEEREDGRWTMPIF